MNGGQFVGEMIAYLEGKIIFKTEKFIILDVNGVGYKVFLSRGTLNKIPEINSTLKLFCYLVVRENALDLYGFLTHKELEFFEILLDIPGIGPKAALEISSLGPLEKIKKDIEIHNEKIFEGIPGIGKKKVQTIILELSGRIKEIEKPSSKQYDEAEEALINLGFSKDKVREALSKIPKETKDTENRIKEALKNLGK